MFHLDDTTRHAAHLRQLDAAEHERRESRKDLLAFAARHKLLVKWEPSGPPNNEMVPKLYKPGNLAPEDWPPNAQRR